MAGNNLTVEQSYQFMTNLYEQAVGKTTPIAVVDTGSFVSVGQVVLKSGFEQTLNAIGVVLNRTIFSIRPYAAKFKGINVDTERFGGMRRKINYIDTTPEESAPYTLVDGQSVDMYKVNKPKVLQMNFYGSNAYQRHITIMESQLTTAFNDAAEFGRFIGGIITNMTDTIEQDRENESRATLINMAAGKFLADSANAVNVLQAYYDETGVELTPATMYAPANYENFVKWFYSYVNTLCDSLSERSYKYHMNVTGKEIARHTPENRMKAYMSAGMLNKIAASVLSSVFNEDRLKMIDFEKVVYWQNINEPTKITATPTYLNVTDGSLVTAEAAVSIDNMLGMIFDEEALGINIKDTAVLSSPVNASGRYYNLFYHYHMQYLNDFTENCVIFYAGAVNRSGKTVKA